MTCDFKTWLFLGYGEDWEYPSYQARLEGEEYGYPRDIFAKEHCKEMREDVDNLINNTSKERVQEWKVEYLKKLREHITIYQQKVADMEKELAGLENNC